MQNDYRVGKWIKNRLTGEVWEITEIYTMDSWCGPNTVYRIRTRQGKERYYDENKYTKLSSTYDLDNVAQLLYSNNV